MSNKAKLIRGIISSVMIVILFILFVISWVQGNLINMVGFGFLCTGVALNQIAGHL